MQRLLAGLVLSLLLCSRALAWGETGHRVVGYVAASRLREMNSEKTLAAVNRILAREPLDPGAAKAPDVKLEPDLLDPADLLGRCATWADNVKRRDRAADRDDADTRAFLADKGARRSGDWHFVDLPLDTTEYDPQGKFSTPTDIIHTLNLCIARLQGGPAAAPWLTERNALRMLVHLAGDIHQPLHAGSAYVRSDMGRPRLVFTTEGARHGSKDVGGNILFYQIGKQLHSLWDTQLVNDAMGKAKLSGPVQEKAYAEFLITHFEAERSWEDAGDAMTWPAAWAIDSVKVSRLRAYDGVRIDPAHPFDLTDQRDASNPAYFIIRPKDYEADNVTIAQQQLTKAGYRLANLLDAIFEGKK